MKILIISDSHGNKSNIDKAVSENDFDYLFFLGDGVSDLGNLKELDNLYAVRGNCDFFSNEVLEHVVTINGVVFLLVHGHTYGVKSGLGGLLSRAKEVGAEVVLFGHTHQFFKEVIDGITFINPGTIGSSRGENNSFVVMNLEQDKIEISCLKFKKFVDKACLRWYHIIAFLR